MDAVALEAAPRLEYTHASRQHSTLTSNVLIIELDKKFNGEIEFGAIQKLVNMTLKYILTCNMLEYITPPIDIDEKNCDCPLDSKILAKLDNEHTPWTRIDKSEYDVVQGEIRKQLEMAGHSDKGNIYFDFINWE